MPSASGSQIGAAAAVGLIVVVLGFVLANRPLGGVGAQVGPGATGSSVASASLLPSAELNPSLSAVPIDSQSPGSTPSPSPTPLATREATANPATPKPTPTPVPGAVHCISEPTGWSVAIPHEAIAGGSMSLELMGFPTGQKMSLVVDYPDGRHVPLGDRYAGLPDAGGWTHMVWTWTVPIDMIPGAARASYAGTCIEGRIYDDYGPFTVVDPNPTPTWSVWSTSWHGWPGGPGQVRVQAYNDAMCTVTATYPDARTTVLGPLTYNGSDLDFLWTIPADVPVGTGSYHVSCNLAGAIRTDDGVLPIDPPPS